MEQTAGETELQKILVGVGGWAYVPVKHQNKLELCSRIFDFVEVNSTYYKLPPLDHAKKWRASVRDDFEFTMRANARLTHETHLEPTESNFKLYANHIEICRELRATVLHFQFPPTFAVTRRVIQSWKDFLNSVLKKRSRDLSLAFEIRHVESEHSPLVKKFFDEYDIIPTSDASKTGTLDSSRSGIIYSRVFGLGEHTKWSFATPELETLKDKVQKTFAKKKYVTFHNFTMYEDAARFRSVVTEGVDPLPPREVGIESFRRAIISARVDFPISKVDLVKQLSWRTFDSEQGKRVHLSEWLDQLPQVQFKSLDEVLKKLPRE